MKILTAQISTNYRLLDSGHGFKLEQFGTNTIVRPDTNCVWAPQLSPEHWAKADARYGKKGELGWSWQQNKNFKEPWLFSYNLPASSQEKKSKSIICQLRLSQSKNIGVFPEQSAHWAWMADIIHSVPYRPNVLNLFGYTGAATLVAAAAGAEVCHVDASRPAVSLGKENQSLSKLDSAEIRWIVDDCSKFVMRELKREVTYDALIIDPPAFGRDQKGNVFEFEKKISKLLEQCTMILKEKPLFVIFNGYSMGYSATVLFNLLSDFFPKETIEFGELQIPQFKGTRDMPCSIYARFSNKK